MLRRGRKKRGDGERCWKEVVGRSRWDELEVVGRRGCWNQHVPRSLEVEQKHNAECASAHRRATPAAASAALVHVVVCQTIDSRAKG